MMKRGKGERKIQTGNQANRKIKKKDNQMTIRYISPMKTSKTCLSKKDVLSLIDVSSEEIFSILELASRLKKKSKRRKTDSLLRGNVLGMIFQNPSTRTRESFKTEMY